MDRKVVIAGGFGDEIIEVMKKHKIKSIKPIDMEAEINSDGEGMFKKFYVEFEKQDDCNIKTVTLEECLKEGNIY